jgi:hypothetical protein
MGGVESIIKLTPKCLKPNSEKILAPCLSCRKLLKNYEDISLASHYHEIESHPSGSELVDFDNSVKQTNTGDHCQSIETKADTLNEDITESPERCQRSEIRGINNNEEDDMGYEASDEDFK